MHIGLLKLLKKAPDRFSDIHATAINKLHTGSSQIAELMHC